MSDDTTLPDPKMHAWPDPKTKRVDCCGQLDVELPLSDGRTSEKRGVTCDGTVVETLGAHEVYPHPDDGWEANPVADDVKYHLARALALQPEYDMSDLGAWSDRVTLLVTQRHVACLMVDLTRIKPYALERRKPTGVDSDPGVDRTDL
jgi:hypothetical protein